MTLTETESLTKPTLAGHIQIARIDHWFKNVFMIPGAVVALAVDYERMPDGLWLRAIVGTLSICLVASSNYVVNEVLDAPTDRKHPVKRNRPVPSGKVSIPLAYVQWLALMVVGVGLGFYISVPFGMTALVLWIMGCAYNIRPVRTKDVPYLDVLSEAVNNPLRMLAGWYLTLVPSVAPASLLFSYWMIGCYFMAIKRYAEYREIGDGERAAAYRKSFRFYTEERLLVSIMFYASASMLFLGSFVMRYRMELILAFPLVALVMALYLQISFRKNSPVQNPEHLYRERGLMAAVTLCSAACVALLVVDLPIVASVFSPTAPSQSVRIAQ